MYPVLLGMGLKILNKSLDGIFNGRLSYILFYVWNLTQPFIITW